MVLLTPLPNNFNLNFNNFSLKHYKVKQSNGISHKNLRCMTKKTASEDCCYSTSIADDRVMEIERYYDAFPALGTRPAGAHHTEKVPLPKYDSKLKTTTFQSSAELHSRQEVYVGGNDSPRLRCPANRQSGSPRLPRSNHVGYPNKVGHKHSHQNANYGKSHEKRHLKYPHSKPRSKNHTEKHRKESLQKSRNGLQKSRNGLRVELKPWKHLPDVKETPPSLQPPCVADVDEVKVDAQKVEFISDDVLATVLNEGSTEGIRHLWDVSDVEKKVEIWQFNQSNNYQDETLDSPTFDFSEENIEKCVVSLFQQAEGDQHEVGRRQQPTIGRRQPMIGRRQPSSADYDWIEESLASLKVCDDITDSCGQSKILPLFHENPFSYMMQTDDFGFADVDKSLASKAFTCKHCQETFEIVLESEMDSKNERYSGGVLGLVDSRLNFDWCKYHPPPWLTAADEVDATAKRSHEPMLACDCDFCRFRIWKKTCKRCGTPI